MYMQKTNIAGNNVMDDCLDNIYVVSSLNGIAVFNLNNMKMLFLNKAELDEFKIYLLNSKNNSDSKYKYFLEEPELVGVDTEFTLNPTISTGMACNYSCNYCYEKNFKRTPSQQIEFSVNNIDLFYEEYCKIYNKPFKYGDIAIIGGEPLLHANEKILTEVLEKWHENKIIISTNGVNIVEFWDKMSNKNIELHVSLDGIKSTHYKKRYTTVPCAYEKTIDGIKLAIEHGFTVHIMCIFFAENRDEYSDFFDELEAIGWLKNPNLHLNFILKTDGGNDLYNTNYLRECIDAIVYLKKMDNRILQANISKMIPGINCFTMDKGTSKCSIYKCIKLYTPSYVFNPDGKVSVCTMTDKPDLIVGTYYPRIQIDRNKIDTLQMRNILDMEKCSNCKYALICRGGCLASSLESGGGILSPMCGIWNTDAWMYGYDKLIL